MYLRKAALLTAPWKWVIYLVSKLVINSQLKKFFRKRMTLSAIYGWFHWFCEG